MHRSKLRQSAARWRTLLVVLVIFASACGSSNDPSATPAVPTTVGIDETTVAPAPTTTAEVVPTTEAPMIPSFPPPALPIKQAWEFDQPFYKIEALDESHLVMAFQNGLRKFNINDGSFEDLVITPLDHHRIEAFFVNVHTDGVASISGDKDGQGSFDLSVSVDTNTMTTTGVYPETGVLIDSHADGTTIARWLGSQSRVDARTLEPLGPIDMELEGLFFAPQIIDDEYWIVDQQGNGVVVEWGTFDEVATFQLDANISPNSFIVSATDEFVLIRASEVEMFKVSRVDYLVERLNLDVRDEFDELMAMSDVYTDDSGTYVEYRFSTEEEKWFVLGTIDHSTGEVGQLHTIARADPEYGFDQFQFPRPSRIGDRLFIRDHIRRLVEVDVGALGAVSEPWVDPEIDVVPVLTADEQAATAVGVAFLSGSAIAITDPSISEGVLASIDKANESKDTSQGWVPFDITIDGDRAWTRIVPAARSRFDLGWPLNLLRIDGEWVVDVDFWCDLQGSC